MNKPLRLKGKTKFDYRIKRFFIFALTAFLFSLVLIPLTRDNHEKAARKAEEVNQLTRAKDELQYRIDLLLDFDKITEILIDLRIIEP